MAGTFADQAVLATDNAFINKCRVALIFRATQLMNSTDAQSPATLDRLNQANAILSNAGSQAPNIAWLVATGNATIAAAAPVVPIDGDVQFAVNTLLDLIA